MLDLDAVIRQTPKGYGFIEQFVRYLAEFRDGYLKLWHEGRIPASGRFINQFGELGEEVFGVVRAGRGLGVVLDAEYRVFAVPHSLDGLVVQIDVRDFDVGGERVRVDREPVVLRGDCDAPALQILHGLVASVVPELQFEGAPAIGVAEQLMPQANAEDRLLPDEFAEFLVDITERRGISRAVGKKDAVRVHGENILRGSARGNDAHLEAVPTQVSEDVALYAIVVGDDVITGGAKGFGGAFRRPGAARLPLRVPLVRLRGRHVPDVIHPDDSLCFRRLARRRVRGYVLRGQDSLHRTLLAQMAGQGARIDPFDPEDVPPLQIGVQRHLGAPTARYAAQLLDDESLHVRPAALLIGGVYAIVADERVGHRDDLPLVGWVREHFLVTGHRRVETDLAKRRPRRSEGFPTEASAVLQCQERAHRTYCAERLLSLLSSSSFLKVSRMNFCPSS